MSQEMELNGHSPLLPAPSTSESGIQFCKISFPILFLQGVMGAIAVMDMTQLIKVHTQLNLYQYLGSFN